MLITKAQAQEILGGSERKIERLVKSGKLPVAHYEKGARKPTPFFDQAQVEALKEEAQTFIRDDDNAESDKPAERQTDTAPSRTLVKAVSSFPVVQAQDPPELYTRLVEVLETLTSQTDKAQSVKPTLNLSDLSVKLLLTLAECSALTGLSRAVIRAAIDANELEARQIGKAWRIKRSNLERWVEKL